MSSISEKKQSPEKKKIVLLLTLVLVVSCAIFLVKPEVTGMISGRNDVYTEPVNIIVDDYAEKQWVPEEEGTITSIRLSGRITGEGKGKVYLKTGNKTLLVFDSTNLEKNGLEGITGYAAEEEESTSNMTIDEITEIAEEPNVTEKPIEKKITIKLKYNSGTKWDSDNNGIEDEKGVVDLTVEDSVFNWDADENKLCTLWKIYSDDAGKITSRCFGSEDCCRLAGLSPTAGRKWDDPYFSFIGYDEASHNNEISARVIYYDVDINVLRSDIVESELQSLDAGFVSSTTYFSVECEETCNVELNETSYKFVVNAADLRIEIFNVSYGLKQPAKTAELKGKKDFLHNETPEFNLKLRKRSTGKINASVFRGGDRLRIKPEIEFIDNKNFRINVPSTRSFKPGKYRLHVEIDGKIIEQDFTWGVLAINTHKSIYLPDEEAFIGMGVLDDEGKMVCDANVTLTVISPANEITTLSTSNGNIMISDECSVYGITNLPDYYAHYNVTGVGTYIMELTAVTPNGIREIVDSFTVQKSVRFDVARNGPTRIYPPVKYNMNFIVKANEDYSGTVREHVPSSFAITPQDNLIITESGDEKILTWNVSFLQGEIYSLDYEFDAPDISPYFFILGTIEIGSWEEKRQWQIAGDVDSNPNSTIEWVQINMPVYNNQIPNATAYYSNPKGLSGNITFMWYVNGINVENDTVFNVANGTLGLAHLNATIAAGDILNVSVSANESFDLTNRTWLDAVIWRMNVRPSSANMISVKCNSSFCYGSHTGGVLTKTYKENGTLIWAVQPYNQQMESVWCDETFCYGAHNLGRVTKTYVINGSTVFSKSFGTVCNYDISCDSTHCYLVDWGGNLNKMLTDGTSVWSKDFGSTMYGVDCDDTQCSIAGGTIVINANKDDGTQAVNGSHGGTSVYDIYCDSTHCYTASTVYLGKLHKNNLSLIWNLSVQPAPGPTDTMNDVFCDEYYCYGGHSNGYITKVDKSTGDVIWSGQIRPNSNHINGIYCDEHYCYGAHSNGYLSKAYKAGNVTVLAAPVPPVDHAPNVTNLTYPQNNTATAAQPISFNFTVQDDHNVTNCTLWANFSGSWRENITIYPTTNNSATYNITMSPPNGTFIWNVKCFDNATTPNSSWHSSNFTIKVGPPLTGPYDINASINSTHVIINWAQIPLASFYRVYGGNSVSNLTNLTEIFDNNFTDTALSGHERKFYVISSVNSSRDELNSSTIVVMQNYTLRRVASVNTKNWITLPFNSSTYVYAYDIIKNNPNITAVTMRNATNQSAITCNTLTCPSACNGTTCNFTLQPGISYEVNVQNSGDLEYSYIWGGIVFEPVQLSLKKMAGSYGKNWISLPYNTSLMGASELMDSIGNTDSVSWWNSSAQSSQGWISAFGGTGKNFTLDPSRGYEVSVTTDTTWMQE
ncbi:hypothetical protein JXA85_00885 [Candidatus Woesearchaeota archaeon]|nr:hypothetical protein [Candidatus Woesearchaeota archaeon]